MNKRPDLAIDTAHRTHEAFVFGPFRLIPAQKLLMEGDKAVVVGARAFDLLVALARRPGEVVSKVELLAAAWPGLTVEEANLRVHIAGLRKAIGDGQGGRRFIVNNPGRGYSFVAPVSYPPSNDLPARLGQAAPPPSNLTRPGNRMIGRDDLIQSMITRLSQHRFITVTGSGGIGKTTVALAVANAVRTSYRDGTRLVDFAPVAEAALVPSALSSALGLPVTSDAPIRGILNVLRDKEKLLVLDNCEHVVEATATLAHEVFQSSPGVHILATSRQPLRVVGEHVQRLPPLEMPPADPRISAAQALTYASVQLFTERASAVEDTFELSDANAPSVAMICRRLDGIALAIEFAAARVDVLGARGVADRLDDRFRLLKRGLRTAHPRHQTLQATFDWSYELLPNTAQAVLARLAVFAGQFTFASAAAVAGDEEAEAIDITEELSVLVSASLTSVDLSAEPVMYRLLESTRAYALRRLCESGEYARASRRHAQHFLRLLGEAESASSTLSNASWVKVHGHQLDNLRVALDWACSEGGDAQLGTDLTIAAVPLWQRLSLTEECRSRAEAALATLTGDGARAQCQEMQLHAALGGALALRSDTESTAAWSKALEIAEVIGDGDYQLRALRGLWRNAYTTGASGAARMFAQRFADVVVVSGAESMRRVGEYMAGMNLFYAGELAAARLNIEKGMRVADTPVVTSDVLHFSLEQTVAASANLSNILWLQGYPDEAIRMAERSIEFASSAGHGLSLAYALAWCACKIALQTGDLAGAQRCLERLAEQASWDSLGQWDVISRCWAGVLRAREGHPDEAADLLDAALHGVPEGNFRLHQTSFLGEKAHALGRIGKSQQAFEAIDRSIAICDRLNERWFFAELLRFKGEIVLGADVSGGAEFAEKLFKSSLDWAKKQGALSWELRAAISLTRLKQAQGKTGEGRDCLAPVYEKFGEGFKTADLRTAAALLHELA
jgi:predicted ATPase/DNA-binding winged helix-turn-helix (wHTH) protein